MASFDCHTKVMINFYPLLVTNDSHSVASSVEDAKHSSSTMMKELSSVQRCAVYSH